MFLNLLVSKKFLIVVILESISDISYEIFKISIMFDLRKILFVVLLIVMFAFWTDGISLLGISKQGRMHREQYMESTWISGTAQVLSKTFDDIMRKLRCSACV
ncbi:uncharacterized protein LOC114121316 [Aphis gossypii]|uniref:uncharacterized protein LOC114121316 n=1 Tax=Aphis gossypii TaxID=80765 RepID=UPI00100FDD43|nr:uncharacterized protein LOC114121316 [Aphis gossypii]